MTNLRKKLNQQNIAFNVKCISKKLKLVIQTEENIFVIWKSLVANLTKIVAMEAD